MGEVSGCTSSFPSRYHIDTVEGNTHYKQQSLFPDITFNCTGILTRWIFTAGWEDYTQAYTELQRETESMYDKVGGTTVQFGADGQSSTEVYGSTTGLLGRGHSWL